jgi:hypothetical protein
MSHVCPKCGGSTFSGPKFHRWCPLPSCDHWKPVVVETLRYTCETCGYIKSGPTMDAAHGQAD